MNSQKWLRVVSFFAITLALSPLFQNCSGSNQFSSQSSSQIGNASFSGGGNGNGYDGKLLVHLLPSGTCADGTKVEGRIQVEAGVATLFRENCTDLPAQLRRVVQLTFNVAGLPTYSGRVFTVEDQAPVQLALQHTPNTKVVTTSWAGGQGLQNCVLQGQTFSGQWVNLASVDCSSTAPQTVTLSSVIWSRPSLRLASQAGTLVLSTFPTGLSCAASGQGSSQPTPNVDEDCDGNFDNIKQGEAICTQDNQATIPANTTYNFPSTIVCEGQIAQFKQAWFTINNGEGARYSDSSCTTLFDLYMGHSSILVTSNTGTVPNSSYGDINSTACQREGAGTRHFKLNAPGWSSARAFYNYTSTLYH